MENQTQRLKDYFENMEDADYHDVKELFDRNDQTKLNNIKMNLMKVDTEISKLKEEQKKFISALDDLPYEVREEF